MNSREALDKEDIEGFKRVKGNKKFKLRKLSKIEEDGSKTTVHTLEIDGKNQLHNWEGPALINKKQKRKEYYLNGIEYDKDTWKEIMKSKEGLPWYKNPAHKGQTRF